MDKTSLTSLEKAPIIGCTISKQNDIVHTTAPSSLITQVTQDDSAKGGKSIYSQMAKKLETQLAAPATTQPSALAAPSTASTRRPSSALIPSLAARQSTPFKLFFSTFFSCCVSTSESASNRTASTLNAAERKSAKAANSPKAIVKSSTLKTDHGTNNSVNRASMPPKKSNLLKLLAPEDQGKKCLVLDLDETLVHSSFKPVPNADFVIPVEIDNQVHNVYVLKRPGVDQFLQRLGPQFETVVFTASLSKYADPVLDMLDKHKAVKHRLFRESCINHKGNYVKDLSMLGRDLKEIIIIDNAPASYIFHPSNAIPITSWFNDPNDTELLDLIPFLEDLKMVENVTTVLDQSQFET